MGYPVFIRKQGNTLRVMVLIKFSRLLSPYTIFPKMGLFISMNFSVSRLFSSSSVFRTSSLQNSTQAQFSLPSLQKSLWTTRLWGSWQLAKKLSILGPVLSGNSQFGLASSKPACCDLWNFPGSEPLYVLSLQGSWWVLHSTPWKVN